VGPPPPQTELPAWIIMAYGAQIIHDSVKISRPKQLLYPNFTPQSALQSVFADKNAWGTRV